MTVNDKVRKYQNAFAAKLSRKHAFAFWKGRVALYAILKGLGLTEGDEVIMPGYTCVMAVNPIVYLGAKPVFVDIEPRTFNLDPNQIESKITARTRLIIAQHTYGIPADLAAIRDISNRKGIPFIEDCCLALGSTYDNQMVGKFGLAAYFSFQWNKPYTSGLGGMAVTDDAKLAEHINGVCEEELLSPGFKRRALLSAQLAVYRTCIYPRTTALAQNVFRWLVQKGLLIGSSSDTELRPVMEPEFFMGMSNVQAHSGHRQLRHFDSNIKHRITMRDLYSKLLAEQDWPVLSIPARTNPVLVRYPVRVNNKEEALAGAAKNFIELGSWFEVPLHPKETRMDAFGYHHGICPEAERASREVVNLPLHPRADAATARKSVEYITRFGFPS